MINYNRLVLCILFLLRGNAVYALPTSDEIIESLGVGKDIKWAIDLERTSCHLGSDPGNSCSVCNKNLVSESLVFVSKDKVEKIVSCDNNGTNIITKTTKTWSVQLDEEKHNNIIKLDNDIYGIFFNIDSSYMKLTNTPGKRSKNTIDMVYKRIKRSANKN